MPFKIEYGDITTYTADAIVIPANPKAAVGNGVDKLIYKLAGRNRMLEARRKIGEMDFGEANLTDAFDLRKNGIKYVIHAVSPGYIDGQHNEAELLRSCYVRSLQCATEFGCNSIVFPLLSTGVLNYPVAEAKEIAKEACAEFSSQVDITIVLYDKDRAKLSEDIDTYLYENDYSCLNVDDYQRNEKEWASLPAYREEHQILDMMRKRYARLQADKAAYQKFENKKRKAKEAEKRRKESYMNMSYSYMTTFKEFTLDSYIGQDITIPTFDQVLTKYMKQNNIKSYAEISRRGQIYEGTLSKMRSEVTGVHRDYLWSIAIALKLNMQETEELFNSCNDSSYGAYRMSEKEIRREFLIRFYIEKGKYDIDDLNDQLNKRGFELLGNMQKNAS